MRYFRITTEGFVWLIALFWIGKCSVMRGTKIDKRGRVSAYCE